MSRNSPRSMHLMSVLQSTLLLSFCIFTLNGCNSQNTELLTHYSSAAKEQLSQEIANLVKFDAESTALANSNIKELKAKMDAVLIGLDSLATEKNLTSANIILEKISAAQRNTFNAAAAANELKHKGLWLAWSERLLLTQDALKHFFSELLMQKFERELDANQPNKFEPLAVELKTLIHRDHERRLISMLRRQQKNSRAFQTLVDLLATSGGPLARLNFYQRFITEPDLQLANAIAKTGLPRVSDLLGENIHLNDGIPFAPNSRTKTYEYALPRMMDNLKQQWKDMKEYLATLETLPARFERARNKWLEVHQQIEFSISLLSISDLQKDSLKKQILQSYISKGEPSELVYRRGGIDFREGDILLVQTGSLSGLWETFTQSGANLSHLLMVTFGDDGLPYTVEMNFGRILVAPLDLHTDRYTVVRFRSLTARDRLSIHSAFAKLFQQNINYDFKFNSKSQSSLYCSELPAAVLELSELSHKPILFAPASSSAVEILHSAGISDSYFYTQGSFLSSHDFEVIAQHVNSDPKEFIRGQIVLDAFTNYVSNAKGIKFHRHPESHQIWTLAALAQTTGADLRRALGPQKFLFTVMTLDKLIHSIETDTLRVTAIAEHQSFQLSRITSLKSALVESLKTVIPKHLSTIFPAHESH